MRIKTRNMLELAIKRLNDRGYQTTTLLEIIKESCTPGITYVFVGKTKNLWLGYDIETGKLELSIDGVCSVKINDMIDINYFWKIVRDAND